MQKEIEFYKKRIISLRPLVPESLKLSQLAERSAQLERKVVEINVQNEALQIEIAKLSQDLQSQRAKYKALVAQLETSDSKKGL